VRVRATVGEEEAQRVGAARLPLPQGVTVHDCVPEGQPDGVVDEEGVAQGEGEFEGRPEAVRESVCVPQEVALRQVVGDREGLPEPEGEPLGEPLGGGVRLLLAVPAGAPPGAGVRVTAPDPLRLALAVPPEGLRVACPEREGEALSDLLTPLLPEVLTECEGLPAPLRESGGDTVLYADSVSEPRGEALVVVEVVLRGVSLRGALPLTVCEGDSQAESEAHADAGGESVCEAVLLREGDSVPEGEPEGEGVPLALMEPEVQRLRDPGAVPEMERLRQGEGVPEGEPLEEPPAAAPAPST
jgi:hypothetical protein